MNIDDLEQKLRRQPLREVPRECRAQILSACGAPVSDPARSNASGTISTRRAGGRRSETPWWLAWLNPSRAGWAALAAAWLLIAGFQLATHSDATRTEISAAPASAESWLEQRRLIAELLELPAPPAEPAAVTRPRGDRRTTTIFLCV